MIEPIMFLAIGFLLAALLGLGIVPLVHARAVRLTMKRLEASTPLSLAEIQADKDQLRAEFAVSARRLEMSIEQLKARSASQFAELGKKTDAVNRLRHELDGKNAMILDLEAREQALKDQLGAAMSEIETKSGKLLEDERALAERRAEIARLTHELTDRTVSADSRQVELVAMTAQMELLRSRLESSGKDLSGTREKLEQERSQHSAAAAELAATRERAESLGARLSEVEGQLAAKTQDAATLSGRVAEIEAQHSAQGRNLAERDAEAGLLRQQVELAHKTESDLRKTLAETADGGTAALEQARKEKADLEQQVETVRRDMAAAVAEAQSSWTTERAENAQLRERINDIAAEVARLAMVLEGPDSPIEAILAAEPARSAAQKADAGKSGANGARGPAGKKGALAERIKALQAHTSRAG